MPENQVLIRVGKLLPDILAYKRNAYTTESLGISFSFSKAESYMILI
jgi:hypothetical protein